MLRPPCRAYTICSVPVSSSTGLHVRSARASNPESKSKLSFTRSGSRSASTLRIASIPADGIGKEVVPEAQRTMVAVLKRMEKSPKLEFVPTEAGWETFQKHGEALPSSTVQLLKTCDGALFGAVSSPSHKVPGYSSPIVAMRKIFNLYANLRPIQSTPIKGSRANVDMMIVRENTECLYIKKERLENDGNTAVAERWITRHASTAIAHMAFKQARSRFQMRQSLLNSGTTTSSAKLKQPKVTIVHKSNVLSVSDGLFRECCLAVAKQYPEITTEEQLVDSMVYKMILNPENYDVVVAPNLYGDILSDAGAALVGGLGVVPSANVSDSFALCEPVHGSAPDIEGKGIANPIATIRASGMLLQHLASRSAKRDSSNTTTTGQLDPLEAQNLHKAADLIEKAVAMTLKEGPCTPDLGGKATTAQVTDSIIQAAVKLLSSS